MKNRRRIRTYGIFYGIKILDENTLKCPFCDGTSWQYVATVDPNCLDSTKEYRIIIENLPKCLRFERK